MTFEETKNKTFYAIPGWSAAANIMLLGLPAPEIERIVSFSLGDLQLLFARGVDKIPVMSTSGLPVGSVMLDTANFVDKTITVRFNAEYIRNRDVSSIVPSRYMITFSGFAFSDKDDSNPRMKVKAALFHRKPRQRPTCIIKNLQCVKVESTKFGNQVNKYNITDSEGNCLKTFVEEMDSCGNVINVYIK